MIKRLLLVVLVIAVVALSRLYLTIQTGSSVKQTGVKFFYDNAEIPVAVTFEGSEVGENDVIRITTIPTLRTVVLADFRLTRRSLESLPALKNLRRLDLGNTTLVDDAMDTVARLSTLKELRLAGCSWLKDEHLASLVGLKNLERLELSSSSVTPAGLSHLSQLLALQELTVGMCSPIGDDAVSQLAGLTQLKQLTLSDTELTSQGYHLLCERLPNVKLKIPLESLLDLRDVAQRGKFGVDSSGKISSFVQEVNKDGSVKPLLPGHLMVIGTLIGLKSLNLRGEITDKMFLELGPLPQLETLFLGGTLITDEGLQRLAGFPSLKHLSLYHTSIDGPGLKYLEHTPGLTRLDFESRQGDDMLQYLAPLQNLDEFVISAPITDEGLERMPVLAKLSRAWFNGSQVLGPGIEGLLKQPSLMFLTFRGGLMDDAAIEHIAKLTALRSVRLTENRVTEEGRARLRKLCPSLTVAPR